MDISCHLSFDGQCEIAFRTYEKLFGGKLRTMLEYGQSPLADQVPPEWQRRILHATLVFDDQELLGTDAFPGAYRRPQGFSVVIGISDPEKGRRLFEALADGGRVDMAFQETFWSPGFGVLVDRFGVPWEINSEGAGRGQASTAPRASPGKQV
jgi:PhnB protein